MNPYTSPTAQLDAAQSMATPRPLRVTFQNTFLDQVLFQAYVQLRSPVIVLLLLGFGLAVAIPEWLESARDVHADISLVVTTLIVAGVIYAFQAVVVVVLVVVQRDGNFYRPRTLELSEHAVLDQTSVTRNEVQWPAVHGVTRTPWCIYIRLNPFAAHCIPPRAFPNADAYAHFAETAVTLFKRHRGEG